MLKKITIASAILVATSSMAFADAAPYVGASLGLNNNTFKFNDATNTNTNFSANGATGGIFGGYGGAATQSIYLGGEAFITGGTLSSSTKNINNGNQTAQLKSTYSYGLDFMPGYKMTDTIMLYLKAGVVGTRFQLSENSATTGGFSGTSSQTVGGGRLGLGLQTAVTRNVDFRGEFVHTAYNSFSTFGTIAGTSFKNSIKPTSNQLNFGLAYKFD